MRANQLLYLFIAFASSSKIAIAMELSELQLQEISTDQNQDKNLLTMWPKLRRAIIEASPSTTNILGGKNVEQIKMCLKNKETISAIQKVKSLDLSNLNLTYIPTELFIFTNLENLSLANNKLIYIQYLQSFTKLKTLNLSYNQLGYLELPENLVQLNTLCISNNQLETIAISPNFVNLVTLDASNNRISCISISKTLTKLEYINLKNNYLQSIMIPNSLTNLEKLNLDNNPLHQNLINIPNSIKNITVLPNNQQNCCTIS